MPTMSERAAVAYEEKVMRRTAYSILSMSACAMIAMACRQDSTAPPQSRPEQPPADPTPVLTAQSPLRTCGRPGLNAREAPAALVTNRSGRRLANVPVRFVVGPEGGEVSDPVVMTDGSGVARAGTWRLGNTSGENTVTASVDGSL